MEISKMAENNSEQQINQAILDQMEKYGYKLLDLKDKSIFTTKFDEVQPEISEFTFTNLYMWREYYKFTWKQMKNGDIIVLALYDPTKIIVFPLIGTDYNSYIQELDQLKSGFNCPIEIHRLPESNLKKIREILPNSEIFEDRDNWDYIYKQNDLVELPGKPYATIRRKLNKFTKEVPIEIETLTSANVNLCLLLQEEWCNLRACSDTPSLDNEDKAIKDILMQIEKLDFIGFIVKHKGKVIGYSIGEKLNNSTIICHVEKGDTEYFGLYQALTHIFAENYASDFEYVNREQDLGVPGLRQSKESYQPIKFIKKFIVLLK